MTFAIRKPVGSAWADPLTNAPMARCLTNQLNYRVVLRAVTMRFMMMVRANKDTEAGVMPDEKLIAAMTRY
jgi:hypothetical protein